jgi:hypothetical protein
MSTFNEIDITCEECGEDFRGTVWTAVHAGEDPELKDLLLGGELNIVMCPSCSHTAFQNGFLLYQEPALELVAYVHPEHLKAEEDNLRAFMIQGFSEAQEATDEKHRLTYDPVLLFGLDSLVDLLNAEEERSQQSEIAKTLCKKAGIHIVTVKPSKARRLDIPYLIPHGGADSKVTRDSILAGIDRLLKLNPALSLFADLKKQVYSNSDWRLD